MILRVYAMWNRSKRVLYILLFIYLPQVLLSFVGGGITNTYLSGMSQAKLEAKLESHMWPLVSYLPFLQSLLSKLLMLLFAIFHSSMPQYSYCGAL
jgi:hypothetical protein